MFMDVQKIRVSNKFVVLTTLIFWLLLISTAQAQAQNDVAPEVLEVIPEVIQTSLVTNPYKLESLPGDKVFMDFVLGPGKVELIMEPGESKTVFINVSNRYDEEKRFRIDIEDVGGSTDLERSVVLLGDDTGAYTLKDYLSIPEAVFDLDPNKRAVIPVTITIPPDAEPGGMYGSVLLKTVTRKSEDATESVGPQSAIVSRIGTLFFITVPGDIDAEGATINFSTINNQKWFSKGPIDFQILFENTGSIHLNPYGELRIVNMFDEEVGYVDLDPWFVLPDALRARMISWDRELLYGKYTASIVVERGYDGVTDQFEYTFWVIPWKLITVLFAGLFIFFLLMRFVLTRFEFKRK